MRNHPLYDNQTDAIIGTGPRGDPPELFEPHPLVDPAAHERLVSQAIERGEDVPEHVLAGYPHLAGRAIVKRHEDAAKRLRAAAVRQTGGNERAADQLVRLGRVR